MAFPGLYFRIFEQYLMTDFLDRDQENNTVVKPIHGSQNVCMS